MNEEGPTTGIRSRLALLGLIAAAALVSWKFVGQRYWLDDSFISFRYARHLFEGHGLVYNAGDPVEGYTNFLWTMTAWLGLVLRQEPIHFTQWVSLLAQAVTLWATWRVGRAMGRSGAVALVAPLLLCGQIAFLTYPMTGMETTFFSMLVALGMLGFVERWQDRRSGGILLGLVLLGIALTRFDGFVLAGILFSYPLLFQENRARLRWPIGLFVGGLALYNGWRLWYYPTPLPNTFYAKTSLSLARAKGGLGYVQRFAMLDAIPVALATVPLACLRVSSTARYLIWVLGWQTTYVVIVGGDWMPHFRFLLAVLPALYLLAQEGGMVLWETLAPRLRRPQATALALLAVVMAFHVVPLYRGRDLSELSGKHFRPHWAKVVGEYLDRNLPEDQLIAIEWGGIAPYYTRHRVLDTYGLTDRATNQKNFNRSVYGRHTTPEYIASRKPDVIVPNASLLKKEEHAWQSIQPGGINDYRYYRRFDSEALGYEWRVVEVLDGWYWPLLMRRGSPPLGGQ